MSNARIQFSLASEEVWNAYNPLLKEGEIVTVLKANKKVKLVQGKVGGSTYSESTVIWDQDTAETIMSRAEAAAVTATAQANAASGSASKAAASQAAAATSATNAKASENAAKTSETNAKASETNAKASETNAKASESAAENSATSAASSASTASTQAGKAADGAAAAAGSATQAGTFATTATNKATAADKSATAAAASAVTASDKASEAATSATNAAVSADNAKNEANRAKAEADKIGDVVTEITESQGTVTVNKSDGSSSNFTTFPKFVELPADADLNDYKQEGFYICKTNKRAALLKNCPVKMPFLMEVYNTSYDYEGTEYSWSHQRIITFNASQVYTRAYGSWEDAGWYPWESIPAIGTILPFAGANSIPAGYLVCDGSAISRTTYKKLFDVIGTTYGAGDGTTTFTLPNLIDRFLEGSSAAGNYRAAGLPNITGNTYLGQWGGGTPVGAFYKQGKVKTAFLDNDTSSMLFFDASRSNAIYGNSTTVQPPAVTMRYIIKY